jgi:hypothetical protein
MRILALTIVAVGLVWSVAETRAQTYDPAFPFCMYLVTWGGGGYYDCSYYTMGQCQASASGRTATCSPNPYYAGGVRSPKRNGRRYY